MQKAANKYQQKLTIKYLASWSILIIGIGFSSFLLAETITQVNLPLGTAKPKPKKQKYMESFFAFDSGGKPKTPKELKLVLSGLDSLIKIESPGAKKNDLLMSRSATLLSLGKHYYVSGKTPVDKQWKDSYLKKAMNSAAEAGNSPTSNVNLKARALHVYGMASLYMGNEAKAVEYFEQSTKMDPNSNITPRLSVFIAEYYFDQEQYEKALPLYSAYFSKLTVEEKALVIYKTGWCYLVLKQYENAEKSFLKIVGKKWAGDFAADAYKDLAQTATSHRDEQQIIQFGAENLAKVSPEQLVNFYTDCYMIFLRQSGNLERVALYNEIIRLETRPERRIALSIKKLSSHQKGYATIQIFKDITEVENLVNQSGIKPETDQFRFFAAELELELKRSISDYVSTISKKIKTPELSTELELATRLQKLLWYHVTWFPKSPSLDQTYMISMDNCNFLKDAECSYRIAKLVLKQPNLKTVWPRARLEIVLSLESMSSKDPKYKPEFMQELKAYADTQEGTKDWILFTKKLAGTYVDEKKYTEAEPYLSKILQKENTSENLYRKMLCQFQLKKYSEIAAQVKLIPKEGPFSAETRNLVRESSLNLAKEYNEKNNFKDYEKFLFLFLSLQPDPIKSDLVMADYLQKLLDRKELDKVAEIIRKLPPQKKYQSAYSKTLDFLLTSYFSANRFLEAETLIKSDSSLGKYRDFDYHWLRLSLINKGNLDNKELKVLSSSNPNVRLGFLSLAAVSQPSLVINYFNVQAPINDKEKKIWLLSRQMIEGDRIVEFSPKDRQVFGSVIPAELLPVGPLKSERLTKMVEFPQTNWSQSRLAKITPDAMSRVKGIRRQIMKDLAGQSSEVQRRVILNGINVERKMGLFFDESPIPSGMTPEQLVEYKKEIDSFAVEYYQQISEYQKLLGALISKENEITGDRLPLPNNIAQWPRKNQSPLDLVENEFKRGGTFKTLVILESQKATNKISEEDFYRWRTYAVLTKFPTELAANYMQDELVAFKQASVIFDWKKNIGLVSDSDRNIASEPKSTLKGDKK